MVSLKLRIDIAIKPAISGKIASDFAENRQRFPGESPAISRGIASDFQALSQRNKVDYTHSCQTTLPTGTIYGFVGLISKFLGETSGFVAETSEFVAETLKFVGEISKFVGLT